MGQGRALMTSIESAAQPSLATTISINLGKVALVTVAFMSVIAFLFNNIDYDHLYLDHLADEAAALLRGVKSGPDGLSFSLPPDMTRYDGEGRGSYGFRVFDASGRVIAGKQSALLEEISPWSPNAGLMADFWFVKLQGDKPFHFAGGKRLRFGDTDVLIETMTLGDIAGVHRWVVLHETAEEVWLPMLPLVLLMPFVAVVSIRRALQPLARAARRCEGINPKDPTQLLKLAGLPREAASFVSAINRLMARVSALVQSEKIFIASAAHELRTPLAV